MSGPYQDLLEIVVDLAVLLEAGADDEQGLPSATCADSLERLYTAFDGLPVDGRRDIVRIVSRLSQDERRGANRTDRLEALDAIRASLDVR